MLCINLDEYAKTCGAITGGVSDLGIFDPADFNFIQGPNGNYTGIELRSGAVANDGAKIFPVSFHENEGERTWKHSVTGSSVKYEHEIKAQLPQLSQPLTNFLSSLDEAGVCCGLGVVIRHNDGRIFVAGEKYVNGVAITRFTMKMNGSDGASGKKFDDFNGANVVFKGDYKRELNEFTGAWDSLFTVTESTPPVTFAFKFGFKDTSGAPLEAAITAATGSGTANDHQKISVPSFGNTGDKILWVAEPLAQPAKATWYNSSVNQGAIGAGQTFLTGVTVGAYRVYVTGFATSFTGAAELRP